MFLHAHFLSSTPLCSIQPPPIELKHVHCRNHNNLPDGGMQNDIASYSTLCGNEEYPVKHIEYANTSSNEEPYELMSPSDEVGPVIAQLDLSKMEKHFPSVETSETTNEGPPIPSKSIYEDQLVYDELDPSKMKKNSPLMNTSESTDESPPPIPSKPVYEVEPAYDEPDVSKMKKISPFMNTAKSTDESPPSGYGPVVT